VAAETVSHFIGGRPVRSALGKSFGVADPATGKEYAQVAVGIAGDVNQAVLAAQSALEKGP
jgi:acyl-CoA reductase-like NAD-dependent aldehyde dehydrogenase